MISAFRPQSVRRRVGVPPWRQPILAIMRLVRIGSLFTVLMIAGGIFIFNLRERRDRRRDAEATPESEG